ncbi:MAG: hypothetical protein JNM18_14660 [Planctomycetaceae bacterium]|nr:hypothetical protein [Planctomycetaceae bacterium]
MSPALIICLAIAALASITVLTRLMLAQRNTLIQELHQQAEAEALRLKAEKKKHAKAKRKAG